MTPRQAREEQTRREIERGQEMIARQSRMYDLQTYIRRGWVTVHHKGHGITRHDGFSKAFFVGNVPVIEHDKARHPSEQFMATIWLLLQGDQGAKVKEDNFGRIREFDPNYEYAQGDIVMANGKLQIIVGTHNRHLPGGYKLEPAQVTIWNHHRGKIV